MVAYWDCSATTPVDGDVAALVLQLMTEEFGNAGSRTHEAGNRAKQALAQARERIAAAISCDASEVLFTSGATEADNLALLGLAQHGADTGRRHIVSTQIEHKAVLEPLQRLEHQGFTVDLVAPRSDGLVDAAQILERVQADTLLVSVMHANNETGVLQPIAEIAAGLKDHPAYLHVDAAQSFGKLNAPLQNPRIDFVALSAHKVFGPKGVGALIARRRGWDRPPLTPLMVGGGQERGLRPGTVPVPLAAGFGLAAELASKHAASRRAIVAAQRSALLDGLAAARPVIHSHSAETLPHIVNLSFEGADGEAVMVAWRDLVAISNGSACTSASYQPSHVLSAMGLPEERVRGALRLSWWHGAESVDWAEAARRVNKLRN